MTRKIGYLLVAAAILIVFYMWQANLRTKPKPFSNYTLLMSSWDKYKSKFIDPNGRIIDYENNEMSTSEGQSYAMLRSVWTDDRATFDKVWGWTQKTLKRPGDNLFSWRWGKRSDKSLGVIENGGINSASDADTDIALALILAGKRWNETKYIDEAKPILEDLWNIETATVSGKRYVTAGNWANSDSEIVINPSYWSPYAWRIFDKVDNKHDWNSLISPAYEMLDRLAQEPLDKQTSSGLPPDWVSINKQTGRPTKSKTAQLDTDYSFDAIRVPFRIALDYEWSGDQKAKDYLSKAFTRLQDDYKERQKLGGTYDHSGKMVNPTESPSMYATALGFFMNTDQVTAEKIYKEKIVGLYSNDQNNFREDLPYYDQNWLWFGAGLFNKFLQSYE